MIIALIFLAILLGFSILWIYTLHKAVVRLTEAVNSQARRFDTSEMDSLEWAKNMELRVDGLEEAQTMTRKIQIAQGVCQVLTAVAASVERKG